MNVKKSIFLSAMLMFMLGAFLIIDTDSIVVGAVIGTNFMPSETMVVGLLFVFISAMMLSALHYYETKNTKRK